MEAATGPGLRIVSESAQRNWMRDANIPSVQPDLTRSLWSSRCNALAFLLESHGCRTNQSHSYISSHEKIAQGMHVTCVQLGLSLSSSNVLDIACPRLAACFIAPYITLTI